MKKTVTKQDYNYVAVFNEMQWNAAKMSAGVTPEMNLRNPLDTGDKACKWGIHPGFETHGRRHQKSKTGVSVVPRKKLMSSIFFF